MTDSLSNQKVLIFASALGFIDSVYLAIMKLTKNPGMCIKGVGDCWTVNLSEYSTIYGIPISIFGAFAYGVLVFLFLAENQFMILKNYGLLMAFGISLTGFLYSIYLTYLEIAVIKAVCPFCVVSALCMLVIFTGTTVRLIKNQKDYKLFVEEKNG